MYTNCEKAASFAGGEKGREGKYEVRSLFLEIKDIQKGYGQADSRVQVLRGIVKNPDILLCDEPTGALDYQTGKEILKLIETVNQKYGNTVLMVTHNDAIRLMATLVVKLRDGTQDLLYGYPEGYAPGRTGIHQLYRPAPRENRQCLLPVRDRRN